MKRGNFSSKCAALWGKLSSWNVWPGAGLFIPGRSPSQWDARRHGCGNHNHRNRSELPALPPRTFRDRCVANPFASPVCKPDREKHRPDPFLRWTCDVKCHGAGVILGRLPNFVRPRCGLEIAKCDSANQPCNPGHRSQCLRPAEDFRTGVGEQFFSESGDAPISQYRLVACNSKRWLPGNTERGLWHGLRRDWETPSACHRYYSVVSGACESSSIGYSKEF